MTPERWLEVERLYHAALSREVGERDQFLRETCSHDVVLRREVERLLVQQASVEDFLGEAALATAEPSVSQPAGTRLINRQIGVYRLEALLGAGGMGEVYRARDTKLRRDVAVKILPRAFIADPDRLARFEREARTLAALNHPNIAAIYGIEEGAAVDEPRVRALVLELVDGETLADSIARGPLRVPDALTIAAQIVEALDAAHEKGIVHRDLKPANIKVRPDGTVKVLDFGLAKLTQASAQRPADLSASPTESIGGTREGVILGTPAYMSPEQARGQTVDKRTDIWAFGCVLYEMLTGRAAFGGQTISDTIAAILDREADWTRLDPNTPAPVRRVLQRCLDKDPRRRLRDIGDVAVEIDQSRRPSESATQARAVRHRSAPVIAALMGAGIGGLAIWMVTSGAPSAPGRVVQFVTASDDADALEPSGLDRDVTISPDGTRLVYLSGGPGRIKLVSRALDQLGTVLLSDRGAPRAPFMSSDGLWIGFFELFGRVKKISATGGPITDVSRSVGGAARGAAWYGDTIIFATSDPSTGLWRVPAPGGEPTVLTRPDRAAGELDHFWPEILPGGRSVLFTVVSAASIESAEIDVLDLATGARKVVVRGGTHGQYVPTGHLVYGAAGGLYAAPFDVDRVQITGEAVKVLDQVAITPEGAVNASFSQDGTMAYVPAAPQKERRTLVWVDRAGREEPIAAPPRPYIYPRVSPDGRRIAVEVWDEARDIWIWELGRETLTRITDNPGRDGFPVWNPDSRRIMFGSAQKASTNLFWRAADGVGSVERLTESDKIQFPYSVSPDGSQLLVREDDPDTGLDVSVVSLTGERRTDILMRTAFNEQNAEVSPDGRWLAYQSNESGQDEIYVRPFPAVGDGRWQISTTGGTRPLWARNGRELFYLAPGGLSGVNISREMAFTAGPPTVLIPRRYFSESAFIGRTYDISPDGRRFLMIKESGTAARPRIVVVQNWVEALNRSFAH